MLLAEALQERADNNRRIEQLKKRIAENAVMQENVPPAEDPKELLYALDEVIDRQEKLISAINLTNSITVDGEITLTEMIAQRDMLNVRINAYKTAADSASQICERFMHSEINRVSALNVKNLRIRTDKLSAELRTLDNTIQKLNWSTELVEI